MVQWLGLCASTAGAQVRSLVEELQAPNGSCKLCGKAGKKKTVNYMITRL